MKFRIAALGLCGSLVGACAVGADGPAVGDSLEEEAGPIVRGRTEKRFPQVVAVTIAGYNGSTLCTGTYFDSRMVVTAAHCLRPDAIAGQSFVYFGKDYIGDRPSLPDIPAPGARSDWARVETAVAHPDYDASLNHPDIAILFLDRELPFDPIRLERDHVSRFTKEGKVVGWGGSLALTADISQVEGAGIKRSADVKLLGSPTAADYHADDPNPGMLDPAIRSTLLKTDGRAPRSNTCAGDSGGPLLARENGHDKLIGVGFWTGLWCEDYAMFSRIDPFLDYFDDQSALNGDKRVVPRLECVQERAGGKLTARYGYTNANSLTAYIPYGSKNDFPKDVKRERPKAFAPGDNPFAFSVDFRAPTTLKWQLSPKKGPSTTVIAKASSPRCDPEDINLICGDKCVAALDAECSADGLSHSRCVSDCVGEADVYEAYFGCGAEWKDYLKCQGTVAPDAENWDCSFPGFPATPVSPNCDDQQAAVYTCLGY